jgi:hypothetical protein
LLRLSPLDKSNSLPSNSLAIVSSKGDTILLLNNDSIFFLLHSIHAKEPFSYHTKAEYTCIPQAIFVKLPLIQIFCLIALSSIHVFAASTHRD